jgi:hypothetical protein
MAFFKMHHDTKWHKTYGGRGAAYVQEAHAHVKDGEHMSAAYTYARAAAYQTEAANQAMRRSDQGEATRHMMGAIESRRLAAEQTRVIGTQHGHDKAEIEERAKIHDDAIALQHKVLQSFLAGDTASVETHKAALANMATRANSDANVVVGDLLRRKNRYAKESIKDAAITPHGYESADKMRAAALYYHAHGQQSEAVQAYMQAANRYAEVADSRPAEAGLFNGRAAEMYLGLSELHSDPGQKKYYADQAKSLNEKAGAAHERTTIEKIDHTFENQPRSVRWYKTIKASAVPDWEKMTAPWTGPKYVMPAEEIREIMARKQFNAEEAVKHVGASQQHGGLRSQGTQEERNYHRDEEIKHAEKAIDYHVAAARSSKEIDHPHETHHLNQAMILHQTIAGMHPSDEKVAEHWSKAAAIQERFMHNAGAVYSHEQAGNALHRLGETEQAKESYKKAADIAIGLADDYHRKLTQGYAREYGEYAHDLMGKAGAQNTYNGLYIQKENRKRAEEINIETRKHLEKYQSVEPRDQTVAAKMTELHRHGMYLDQNNQKVHSVLKS